MDLGAYGMENEGDPWTLISRQITALKGMHEVESDRLVAAQTRHSQVRPI